MKRKLLSILLAVVMILPSVLALGVTVSAEDEVTTPKDLYTTYDAANNAAVIATSPISGQPLILQTSTPKCDECTLAYAGVTVPETTAGANDGYEMYICTVCGAFEKVDANAASGHYFVDGACACGYSEADHIASDFMDGIEPVTATGYEDEFLKRICVNAIRYGSFTGGTTTRTFEFTVTFPEVFAPSLFFAYQPTFMKAAEDYNSKYIYLMRASTVSPSNQGNDHNLLIVDCSEYVDGQGYPVKLMTAARTAARAYQTIGYILPGSTHTFKFDYMPMANNDGTNIGIQFYMDGTKVGPVVPNTHSTVAYWSFPQFNMGLTYGENLLNEVTADGTVAATFSDENVANADTAPAEPLYIADNTDEIENIAYNAAAAKTYNFGFKMPTADKLSGLLYSSQPSFIVAANTVDHGASYLHLIRVTQETGTSNTNNANLLFVDCDEAKYVEGKGYPVMFLKSRNGTAYDARWICIGYAELGKAYNFTFDCEVVGNNYQVTISSDLADASAATSVQVYKSMYFWQLPNLYREGIEFYCTEVLSSEYTDYKTAMVRTYALTNGAPTATAAVTSVGAELPDSYVNANKSNNVVFEAYTEGLTMANDLVDTDNQVIYSYNKGDDANEALMWASKVNIEYTVNYTAWFGSGTAEEFFTVSRRNPGADAKAEAFRIQYNNNKQTDRNQVELRIGGVNYNVLETVTLNSDYKFSFDLDNANKTLTLTVFENGTEVKTLTVNNVDAFGGFSYNTKCLDVVFGHALSAGYGCKGKGTLKNFVLTATNPDLDTIDNIVVEKSAKDGVLTADLLAEFSSATEITFKGAATFADGFAFPENIQVVYGWTGSDIETAAGDKFVGLEEAIVAGLQKSSVTDKDGKYRLRFIGIIDEFMFENCQAVGFKIKCLEGNEGDADKIWTSGDMTKVYSELYGCNAEGETVVYTVGDFVDGGVEGYEGYFTAFELYSVATGEYSFEIVPYVVNYFGETVELTGKTIAVSVGN